MRCRKGEGGDCGSDFALADPVPRRDKLEAARPITLGKNAWLGGGVIVCPGTTIGDNCVIGAGSVVTRDIPANVIAVGNPARPPRDWSPRFHWLSAHAAPAEDAVTTQDGATDDASAQAAVVDEVLADQRDIVLTHEFYTLARRGEAYRDITSRWMAASRSALEHYFDQETAGLLDALIEGLTIHRSIYAEPQDADQVARAIRRVCNAVSPAA